MLFLSAPYSLLISACWFPNGQFPRSFLTFLFWKDVFKNYFIIIRLTNKKKDRDFRFSLSYFRYPCASDGAELDHSSIPGVLLFPIYFLTSKIKIDIFSCWRLRGRISWALWVASSRFYKWIEFSSWQHLQVLYIQ